MQLHPFPEPDAPELEPYMLYSHVEIVSLLGRICDDRILNTVYTGGNAEFAVTMIVNVNPDFDEVTFDMPVDPAAQKRVLDARDLTFVIFLENIKVQFRAQVAQATVFEERPAFRVRLPSQVLRLQRREYFRVRTPVNGQAKCLVPNSAGASKYESLPVLNISVGGLAVMSYPHYSEMPLGQTVNDCYLDLPGVGSLGVALRAVNVYEGEGDAHGKRFGCEFVDLAPQARQMLQRYINRIETEQRKVAGDARAA